MYWLNLTYYYLPFESISEKDLLLWSISLILHLFPFYIDNSTKENIPKAFTNPTCQIAGKT